MTEKTLFGLYTETNRPTMQTDQVMVFGPAGSFMPPPLSRFTVSVLSATGSAAGELMMS